MKSILLICDRANIDRPLRRSLGHLAGTCQIKVAGDGYQALHELAKRAFNLIIVDFEIRGVDSLELLESVGYIDPGVPAILMLNHEHRSVWDNARALMAHPILRPFKPITFLRLVDTLLHQHLERYRDLSEILTAALDSLGNRPGVEFAFLADDSGTVLMSAGNADDAQRAALGHLAAAQLTDDGLLPAAFQPLAMSVPSEKDHDLLVVNILDDLLLALLAGTPSSTGHLHHAIQAAAQNIQQAIQDNVFTDPASYPAAPVELPAKDTPAAVISIPLKLNYDRPTAADIQPQPKTDDNSVNWQIMSGNTAVLNRLQNILSN